MRNRRGSLAIVEESSSNRVLQEAFQRFHEASQRLEGRYCELAHETESLRKRLREKDEEIKRAERFAMLGQTAAGIAHEVRNPLGAIELFLSLLRDQVSNQPDALELIGQISVSAKQIDAVVANMLHFANQRNLSLAPVDVHALLREQAELVTQRYADGIKVVLELGGNPRILGNESALRQVVSNLVLNACQALKGSGQIELVAADTVDGVLVIIRDSGPGVPEDLLDRLFEPFVTGREEGTGLGLAIVQKIVSQHGGQVKVCNTPGAEFAVELKRRPLASGC